jgi:hypothetical protein
MTAHRAGAIELEQKPGPLLMLAQTNAPVCEDATCLVPAATTHLTAKPVGESA